MAEGLFLRKLTEKQHQEAFELGETLAARISQGSVRPFDAAAAMEAFEQSETNG